MLSTLRRYRFATRMLLGSLPVVYRAVPAVNWMRNRNGSVFLPEGTALVVDGFPGSGNNFAHAALEAAARAHGRPLPRIAHHLHCAGQLVEAARRRIPVLLLVREPVDAVVSGLSRWPYLDAPTIYGAYVRYHERLRKAGDTFAVATFQQLTTDFGAVTERLNERFGADFPVFDHSPENLAAVYRPDDPARAARRSLAAARRPEAEDPALEALRERARALYSNLAALAG